MSDLHESSGSYALDALDTEELLDYEAHLATCPDCRAEVAELCEIAAELSLLSLATPPPGLRDQVMAAIQNTPQVAPERPAVNGHRPAGTNGSHSVAESARAVRAAAPRRALPGTEVVDALDDRDGPATDELAVRRQRRLSRLVAGLVAAALALAVGLGGVVYTLVQGRQAAVAQISREQQLYAAPDVDVESSELKGGGRATFVFSVQQNRALFIGSDLPDPGAGKRYQLWTMDGPEPKWKVATRVARDTRITEDEPAVRAFFTGDIAGSDWLCISVEPEDNLSDTPTVPPVGFAKVAQDA